MSEWLNQVFCEDALAGLARIPVVHTKVWQARLSTQAPDIDGVCYISDPGEAPLRAGEFRRMRITKAHDYDLTGELLDAPKAAGREVRTATLLQISR